MKSVIADWIQKLKAYGKTQSEVEGLLTGLAKLSVSDTYAALYGALTKEDLRRINAVKDEVEAERMILEIFQQRTGTTLEDVVAHTQDSFVTAYQQKMGKKTQSSKKTR